MDMDQLYDYRARLLDRLESIPDEIAQAARAVTPEKLRRPKPSGKMSPHQIVARLRNMEKHAYSARLQKIITEESPSMETFPIERWEAEHYDPSETVESILNEYVAIRQNELQLLRALSPRDWNRSGRHNTFGLRTVQWWAERSLEYATLQLRELRNA
ncbi:MAG: DinB family protein [Chloroflexi bacterium]|nr:DinB family protein [Chloroflexota bacterium]